MADSSQQAATGKGTHNAVLAGFLGWTFDAFDFFVLTFALEHIGKEFGKTHADMALTIAATLATRWIGAIIFGLLADRYGRRIPLIVNILYYSLVEVLSGLAPSYRVFFFLRLLYGIGMGGEWGVGASLTMESIPPKWRGLVSGFLQEGYALGYLLAAVAYGFIYPHWGWRPLFFVGGLPALLTLFVRAKVKEPEAWHRSRTEWPAYRKALFGNWKRFAYLVVFMAMVNFISHGTQDMYPTYLQSQHGFTAGRTSYITPQGPPPRDGNSFASGLPAHSDVGLRAESSAHPGWRILDAIYGARRVGSGSSAHQRTIPGCVARIFPRPGVSVGRADRFRQRLYRNTYEIFHGLWTCHGPLRADRSHCRRDRRLVGPRRTSHRVRQRRLTES